VVRPAGEASSLDQAVFFLHLGRARERLQAGEFDEALQELELARLARPDDDDLLNLVAVVAFRRGDYHEAARVTRALLEKNPGSAILHANLGLILFKSGVHADAERELKRAIALKPDHARSHLYLGLLHRLRGELTDALDHLRRAGARGAAGEIEEILRRAGPTRALEAVPPPEPAPSDPRDAEDRPLFRVQRDGALEVFSRDLVYVREGSVVWYSGRMSFSREPGFAGSRLERLLRARGPGDVRLCEPGRRAVLRDTGGRALWLEGSRLLALSAALRFRLEPIHDFRTHRSVDILKVHGRGEVVFAVAGLLEAHDVSAQFPFCVSSRDLVAWTGDLLASVAEDRFLDEIMMPDVANAPKLRFEGEGVVLTEAPRAI
jgi:tetratricopeptide (TPR) repeat protein